MLTRLLSNTIRCKLTCVRYTFAKHVNLKPSYNNTINVVSNMTLEQNRHEMQKEIDEINKNSDPNKHTVLDTSKLMETVYRERDLCSPGVY